METNPLFEQLQQPDIQAALVLLLQNLPVYEKNLEAMGNIASFGQAVLQDKQAVQKYEELVGSYNINLETIEALAGLLEKLPKLYKMMEQLENLFDFASAVLGDQKTIDYAAESIKSYAEPVVKKGKQGLSLIEEIQQQVQTETEPVKLFKMIKWLKDPNVQQSLKFIQATLTVLTRKID
ncbi:hypothetical protein [Metabacillus fastidiosus]|uniref:hypothetical protein n=1 Tax=Metabacillus fastidiosus TaxID=1458 RepID=UPI002DBA9937|nr:hypothetical protein [Metabacillus fastidiosus]MEC2074513.1 hypothetical protein [Metabacillus fastidiosus]